MFRSNKRLFIASVFWLPSLRYHHEAGLAGSAKYLVLENRSFFQSFSMNIIEAEGLEMASH